MTKKNSLNTLKPYENLINEIKIFFTNSKTDFSNLEEIKLFPKRYCKYGNMLVFNETIKQFLLTNSFINLSETSKENFWKMISQLFKVANIAIVYNILGGSEMRTPVVDMLFGSKSIVSYVENGIKFQWDLRQVMFSRGNISEKLRLSSFNCQDEVVLDMFAGIGYFSLSYLVHSHAKFLYACELNPDSVRWLKTNLEANKISSDRYQVLQGDCARFAPKNVAQRVNLGLIPDCRPFWRTACEALSRQTGGVLHVHENVNSKDDSGNYKDDFFEKDFSCNKTMKLSWVKFACEARDLIVGYLNEASSDKICEWNVRCLHLEYVKSYAPHVDHLVLDLCCRPINLTSSS